MTTLDQALDQGDDLPHRLGGQRLVVGPPELQSLRIGHVGSRHLARELGARHSLATRLVVDLVIDVGDVSYECYDVTLVDKESLQQREDHEGAGVTDMNTAVDGWTAGVDAGLAGLAWLEDSHLAGQGVVQADRAQSAATVAPGGASARRDG